MASGMGDRLRARAKELELTDSEVARRLGLAQSRYAHYVSGTRTPDYQTLERICRTLLTTPNALLGFVAGDGDGERTSQELLLRDRAAAALGAMDQRSLRLAADVLDVIARASGAEPEP